MSYKPIHTLDELQTYLSGATVVAFDFETAPTEKYRKEDKAALDAHKSRIVPASQQVWNTVNMLLRLHKNWRV